MEQAVGWVLLAVLIGGGFWLGRKSRAEYRGAVRYRQDLELRLEQALTARAEAESRAMSVVQIGDVHGGSIDAGSGVDRTGIAGGVDAVRGVRGPAAPGAVRGTVDAGQAIGAGGHLVPVVAAELASVEARRTRALGSLAAFADEYDEEERY